MKKLVTLITCLLLLSHIQSQLITTEPVFPVADKPVTIMFHSDIETGPLKEYTGDLYVHTGVILSDDSKWQYVIGNWGDNINQPKLEYLGNYTYSLVISPDIYSYYSIPAEKSILKIALVVRSSDGTQQTADLFVDVYDEGLNVSFSVPSERSMVIELNQDIEVMASSNMADSMALFRNGEFIAGAGFEGTINYTFSADTYGEYEVVVTAFSAEESIGDTFFYFVRPEPLILDLPEGIIEGINYLSDTSVILCLYAPEKNYVFVPGDYSNWTAKSSNYMNRTPDGKRYWIQLNGLQSGKEYAYQYFVDGTILIADPYTRKVLDPWNDEWIGSTTYPGLKPYPKNLTTGIVSVFQTAQAEYHWKNVDFVPPAIENMVIYELLLRDFIARHDWKTLTDTLDYFTRLGVNALEIMPFSEFEGNESWGYNPSFYFAADKYYGPETDLKRFIDSCHSRGIAVIMDIVLNHSYNQSPLVQLYYDNVNYRPSANNPWYNEVSPNPVYSWGNDFNHESQDTKNFVDRVTRFWLEEFKLDGFRFDFTKGFTNTPGEGGVYDAARIDILKRMADRIWEVNPDAYVILEHFADNNEEKVLSTYGMMIWGNMNYNYNEATMGWNELGKSDFSRVSYQKRGWDKPHLVGYMESHDEERLMYKNLQYGNSSGLYNIKDPATALKRIELAAVFFLTIPGPKMLWQFGEMGYDISIDYNGRVGNKPPKWEYLEEHPRLFPVFANLIHLRTSEPAFSSDDFSMSTTNPVKKIALNHETMDVRIIGNFGVTSLPSVPGFSRTGKWYDYFSGEEVEVSDINLEVTLAPGEYHLYTTKPLTKPDIPLSLRPGTVSMDNVIIYPNPTSEILIIEGIGSPSNIYISDIRGTILKQETLISGKSQISVEGINPGLYILVMETNETRIIRKFVIR